MANDDILRKLLYLAKRPGTAEEGKTAYALAEKIARQRGINLQDFDKPVQSNHTYTKHSYQYTPKQPPKPKTWAGKFNWWLDRQPEPYRFYISMGIITTGVLPISTLSIVHQPQLFFGLLLFFLVWLYGVISVIKLRM